jgi:hypothetical protein
VLAGGDGDPCTPGRSGVMSPDTDDLLHDVDDDVLDALADALCSGLAAAFLARRAEEPTMTAPPARWPRQWTQTEVRR